tara:strand:+ start:10317 stop:10532 length:216 start_codon:yes stop_codon:yes gene_type:complete
VVNTYEDDDDVVLTAFNNYQIAILKEEIDRISALDDCDYHNNILIYLNTRVSTLRALKFKIYGEIINGNGE